jgi:integrase/recombinase XerD
MPREFIQELRGDVRKEAIDIYHHIDKEELNESYLAHIPQSGI